MLVRWEGGDGGQEAVVGLEYGRVLEMTVT